MNESETYKSYKASKYLSIKHSTYFQVYDELLSRFRDQEIVFVEIGVKDGGSLFMWRDYFGDNARIIGIDFNPSAKIWEEYGFEIFIASQSDEKFWDDFFAEIGAIDVMLDDGGHTNEQQIITAEKCIPNIKDNGLLIVEDTHCSYLPAFGNPSKYSFINYSKNLADRINYRFPKFSKTNPYTDTVFSISFYESIVAFQINRQKSFISEETTNGGISHGAKDFRYADSHVNKISENFMFLRKILLRIRNRVNSYRLRRYFT